MASNASRQIQELQILLQHLPEQLPVRNDAESVYAALKNGPDQEFLQEEGAAAAVNKLLEPCFPSHLHLLPESGTRIPRIRERGPAIQQLVPLFREYCATSGPETIVHFWVRDLIVGVKKVYEEHGKALPRMSLRPHNEAIIIDDASDKDETFIEEEDASEDNLESEEETTVPVQAGTKRKARAKRGEAKKRKLAIQEAKKGTSQQTNYTSKKLKDIPRNPKGVLGGRPSDPFISKVTILCETPDGRERVRCAMPGCEESWAGHSADRVVKHLMNRCAFVDEETRVKARDRQAARSLKNEAVKGDSSSSSVKLPAQPKASGSGGKGQTSFETLVKTAGGQKRTQEGNALILDMLCHASLPTHLLSDPTVLAVFNHFDPSIYIWSETTYNDVLIPAEAARIAKANENTLKKLTNLTASFDGGTTRNVQSIYTLHVSTPETRVAYFIDGHAASGESHTGAYLGEWLLKIMNRIGHKKFSAITSDNTGNTSLARKIVVEAIDTVLILPDTPHQLSNLGKDLANMKHFDETRERMSSLITFFRQSSQSTQHLRSKLEADTGSSAGLISIGKTRFLTHYHAGKALLRALPSITALVEEGVVQFPSESLKWFSHRGKRAVFTETLHQLVALLEPLARACTCLESSMATPADCYLFWLAAFATYEAYAKDNDGLKGLNLPEDVFREVRRILNYRFAKMFSGRDGGVYLATLFLHPFYIGSPIFKNRHQNPLDTTVHISLRPATSSDVTDRPSEEQKLRDEMPAFKKVGDYLIEVLSREVNADSHPEIFGEYAMEDDIWDAFRSQFTAYALQRPQFAIQGSETPLEYWQRLATNKNTWLVGILGEKVFSVVPNSMADERTVSTFTRMNTALRGSLEADTLVAMTQIRQDIVQRSKTTPPPRPIVRFADISKYISDTSKPAKEKGKASEKEKEKKKETEMAKAISAGLPRAVARAIGDVTVESDEDLASPLFVEPDDVRDPESAHGRMFPADDGSQLVSVADDGVVLAAPGLMDLLSSDPKHSLIVQATASASPVSLVRKKASGHKHVVSKVPTF